MPESVSRLWDLVLQNTAHLSTGELILRIALIACSLFASVQLLSMWATHYGDHNATSKSFFLSLLLHCCFALGWATVVETMPRQSVAGGTPEKPAVHITMRGSDDDAETGDATKPTWNAATQRPDTELTRMERTDQERPIETPDVEKAPVPVTIPETPAMAAAPDAPAPLPAQQTVESSAASAASPAAAIDQPNAEARPEVRSVATVRRTNLNREMSSVDVSSQVEPQRGAAERMAPLIENGAVLTLPSELIPESAVPKPVGAPDTVIRRRTDPNPVPAEIAEAGSNATSTAATTTGNRRTDPFARSGSRTGADTEFEPTPPVKSRASTPSIPREQMVASRSSISDTTGPAPRPELARPESAAIMGRTATRDPEPYRSRRLEQRRAIALKNGGSEDSERAVEASLRWMASVQEPAGHWSSSRHGGGAAKKDPQGQNRLDGGLYADTGVTGLVVLSFLGAGHTHEEGKYTSEVLRAIQWLIAQQNSNGYLGGRATRYDMMYCHAMATFALAEAYGMQNDHTKFPELRDAVRNGVRLICAMQNDDGGWRYGKGGESDMSMFGWQLMALKSAVNAGIPVPDENRRGMTKFLQARALGARGGLAGYKLNESYTPAMTAEALFCRQMFGVRPRDGASQEAVDYLRRNLPRLSAYDEYYWYYGTLAMFQYDGQEWQEWNNALRDPLVGLQRTQGPLAGSWDPNGKWAGIGGRLYSTAISTMCLEVYYRFLRIYDE
ncbi:MAG: hypothetical protein JSS49_14705 [Planctomycetes bacterium]|nr:hypothetical protein [Planctomycetota bacterium]